MMTCRELVEIVTDYIEGAMPDADRARFEEHLEVCPYCVEYVEQTRATINALGKLPEALPSLDTQERLLQAFRHWKTA